MTYSDFYNKYPKRMYKRAYFKNNLGERFYLIRTNTLPRIYLITGDEYDWEMFPLFNKKANIYSVDEILNMAKALREVAL